MSPGVVEKPTGVDQEEMGGKEMKTENRDYIFKGFSYGGKETGW